MRGWEVLTTLVTLVGGFSAYNLRPIAMPSVQVNCFEVSGNDWRTTNKLFKSQTPLQAPGFAKDPTLNLNEIQRRFDLFRDNEDIAREHAKLVQDINSLRQVVFISPWTEESKDYEDTIYQELIETSTTTTNRPTTTPLIRTTRPTGIPVLLLGGASQRFPTRSYFTTKFPRATINLVGSSATPQITKHPYPFVGLAANSLQRPGKLCMAPTMPVMYQNTRRPTLWERFVSFLPRLQR